MSPTITARTSPATDELRLALERQRDAQVARLAAIDGSAYLLHRLAGDEHLVAAQLQGIRSAIVDLEQAMRRVDDGSYGTCEACSRAIPPARLEIRPHARYCVECQQHHESEGV
jgi:RNA polymerase-binding transcription factor